ncbi:phosphatase PAP2 family protein [Sciscionella sediminilitoris]|uniref:phosphatase PAP2 family protein n=1 Tax=Sciscionella sediminilitoris TaxID=1445613 RepID=UPI0012E2EE69|nr:phosphatase PAP2 family protein [Sciscionella sp. SE31]
MATSETARRQNTDNGAGTVLDRFHRADTAVLRSVQSALDKAPLVGGARALSAAGEHAIGWLAIGLLGAAVDTERRKRWITATGAVAVSHAGAILIKRVVRRPRPHDERVQVLAKTPSSLSMPSAHAMSTASAAVVFGPLLGLRFGRVALPVMALSRLLLGVHYPSDVLTGAVLGAAIGKAANQRNGESHE